jgi:V/A-type H+-transporting ATPase subunit B
MIKLYAAYKDTLEKKSMGFQMTAWDKKLLKYGESFEGEMMDLSVKINLEEALDKGWEILAACFEPQETGLRTDLIEKYWPKKSA